MKASHARRIREGINRARLERASHSLPGAAQVLDGDPLAERAYHRTRVRFWPSLAPSGADWPLPRVPGPRSPDFGSSD